MASTLGVKTTHHSENFYVADLDVASLETFQKILNSNEVDLKEFCDDMAYQGFNKTLVAKMAAKNLGAFLTIKFLLLGAMRGTNLVKILDKSVKVDDDVKKAVKGEKIFSKVKGPTTLTVGRLLSTFPELAAFYMMKNNIPAKLSEVSCPAAIQFPAAAGLPMSHTVRMHHLEFSVRFSFLISGDKKFHPVYYMAAFNGQVEPAKVSPDLQKILGQPTVAEAKSIDMDTAIKAMMEKYGAERFDLTNYKK